MAVIVDSADVGHDEQPSRACIYAAAARAIGARDPDPAVRNPDDLVERLLGDPVALGVEPDHPVVQALSRAYVDVIQDPEMLGSVMMAMIRTRFIDECLQRSIAAGASQVVLLGAGFDTRASRFADLLATIPIPIFEVDRVPTQDVKKRRVSEAFGGTPPNVTYVPIEFQHDDLAAALAAHGYDLARRTFLVWECGTMYLPEAAVRSILTFVGAHPSGSVIAFDYVHQPVIDRIAQLDVTQVPAPLRASMQVFLDMLAVEPWLFGLPDRGERDFLGGFGLEPRDVLSIGGAESISRYLTRSDGSTAGGLGAIEGVHHLVEAVVKGTAVRETRRTSASKRHRRPIPPAGRRCPGRGDLVMGAQV